MSIPSISSIPSTLQNFILLLIIYFIIMVLFYQLQSFYYYKYGDLLNKNCKDSKTEFEDPIFQYYSHDTFFQSKTMHVLLLIIITIMVGLEIGKDIKLQKDKETTYPFAFFCDVGFRWLIGLIISLSLAFILTLTACFDNIGKGKDEENDDLIISMNTFILIYISYSIIMAFVLLVLFHKHDNKKLNLTKPQFIIAFSFFIILCLYIPISFFLHDDEDKHTIFDFIWGFPHSETDNKENFKNVFKKTGPIFVIYTVTFLGLILLNKYWINDNFTNIGLSKNILGILVLLAIFRGLYVGFTIFFKEKANKSKNIEEKLTNLNKQFSNFLSISVSTNNYISKLKESDFDDIQVHSSDTDKTYSTYIKNTERRNINKYYGYDTNKCIITVENYDSTKKQELEDFIIYINGKKDEDTSTMEDKNKFIVEVCKLLYKKGLPETPLNTSDRINKAIEVFHKFIEYIRKPTKYIVDNYKELVEEERSTDYNKIKTIHKDIIENYNELNPNNKIDTDVLYYKEEKGYMIKQEDDDIRYYACLYFPYYNDIDKAIEKYDNYELLTLSRRNLKDTFYNYRNEIDNTNLDIEYIIMVVLCIIIMFIIVSKVPKLDWWSPIYTIILVSIIMIIIFLGINIKIIVDNVK